MTVTYQSNRLATPATLTKVKTTEDGANGHVQHVNVDAVSGTVAVTDNSGSITVDDGASSLTVDGTVAISGTVAVTDNSGSLTVDDGAGSLTVDGTVTVTGGAGQAADVKVTLDSEQVPVKFVDENGTAYGVKHINNKPRVSAMPYLYDIAEGNVAGHTPWNKIGYNGDIDPGTEDLWGVGGAYAFPPSAMQMEVISSSVDDASAGTGVQKVVISYLDNTYAAQSEIVTLNGTTAVATTATNILRVNAFRAYQVGTGKVAAGNIDIRETDDSPVYSRILTGNTRARNIAYTVPLGKELYITSAKFSAIAAVTGADVVFTVRATYDDVRAAVIDFFMPIIELGVQDGSTAIEFEMPIHLPATTDIRVLATSGNNNVICTCALRGWLE